MMAKRTVRSLSLIIATLLVAFSGFFVATSVTHAASYCQVTTCNSSTTGTPTPGTTPTPTSGTTPSPTSMPGGGGTHVDNPYAGARGYVNPEWAARANAEPGGNRISNISTGVWLDSISRITPTDGTM